MKNTSKTQNINVKKTMSTEQRIALTSEIAIAASGIVMIIILPIAIVAVIPLLAIPLIVGGILISSAGKKSVAYRVLLTLHVAFAVFMVALALVWGTFATSFR